MRPRRTWGPWPGDRDGDDLVIDDQTDPGREHLAAERVTCVVLEATSDYWKPFYYVLEDLPGVELILVNARHVKNLPGVRPASPTPPGWLSSVLIGCSAAPSRWA